MRMGSMTIAAGSLQGKLTQTAQWGHLKQAPKVNKIQCKLSQSSPRMTISDLLNQNNRTADKSY